MDLEKCFRAMIENSERPIVICDLDYRIVYANKCAVDQYGSKKNIDLVGSSLRVCFDEEAQSKIDMSVEWFKESEQNNKVFAFHDPDKNIDVYIKALRIDGGELVGFYNSIISRSSETGKAYDLD